MVFLLVIGVRVREFGTFLSFFLSTLVIDSFSLSISSLSFVCFGKFLLFHSE